MMRKIVGKVALLTECAEILLRVVRRIVIKVCGCQNDSGDFGVILMRITDGKNGLIIGIIESLGDVRSRKFIVGGAAEFALPPGSIKSDCI